MNNPNIMSDSSKLLEQVVYPLHSDQHNEFVFLLYGKRQYYPAIYWESASRSLLRELSLACFPDLPFQPSFLWFDGRQT